MTASLSRILFHTLLCVAVWTWGPAALAGEIGNALEKARVDGLLTREEAVAIERRVEEARSRRLPTDSLAAKVHEGLAKRMPGQAIVRAVDLMCEDYSFARSVLGRAGSSPSLQDVAAVGDSLRLGLTRAELSELAGYDPAVSAAMLATAATARAYLNSIRFAPSLSSDLLRQGILSASLTPPWARLFRVVQRARAAGLTDAVVADAAARTLAEGGEPSDLLHALGFTGRDMRRVPDESDK